jgi:hypothetical protein
LEIVFQKLVGKTKINDNKRKKKDDWMFSLWDGRAKKKRVIPQITWTQEKVKIAAENKMKGTFFCWLFRGSAWILEADEYIKRLISDKEKPSILHHVFGYQLSNPKIVIVFFENLTTHSSQCLEVKSFWNRH